METVFRYNGDGVIDSADTGFIDDDNDGMADLSEDTPVIDSDVDEQMIIKT